MKREPEALPEEIIGVLSSYFSDFDLDRVRVSEGIPFYVRGNPVGYADRYRIYLEPGAYRVDTIEGIALLAHEVVHCRQYRRLGAWRFRYRYLLSYFKNRLRGMSRKEAYLNVPFEIEAREIEAQVYLALKRVQDELG
ncbi:MAG: eCIS core domain-containing protein [Blastocatellia bacterium]